MQESKEEEIKEPKKEEINHDWLLLQYLYDEGLWAPEAGKLSSITKTEKGIL